MDFEDLTKKEIKELIEEEIEKIEELQRDLSEKNVIGSWLRSRISYNLRDTIDSYKKITEKFL